MEGFIPSFVQSQSIVSPYGPSVLLYPNGFRCVIYPARLFKRMSLSLTINGNLFEARGTNRPFRSKLGSKTILVASLKLEAFELRLSKRSLSL